MGDSNASLSKEAKEATETANRMSHQVDCGTATHEQAASAHQDAAWKNQRAGNITQQKKHEAWSAIHQEKATPARAAKRFADDLGKHAEKMSKKADMATANGEAPANVDEYSDPNVKDPRNADDLHRAAYKAHTRAAKAYDIGDDEAKKKYHEGKAVEHAAKIGAS